MSFLHLFKIYHNSSVMLKKLNFGTLVDIQNIKHYLIIVEFWLSVALENFRLFIRINMNKVNFIQNNICSIIIQLKNHKRNVQLEYLSPSSKVFFKFKNSILMTSTGKSQCDCFEFPLSLTSFIGLSSVEYNIWKNSVNYIL